MEEIKLLGHCEICGKEIHNVPMMENNPDNALYINTFKFPLARIPILGAAYGSCHDGDYAFIHDRCLLKQIQEKLSQNPKTELYICDKCFDSNYYKFTLVEGALFPFSAHPGIPAKHKYIPVPQIVCALSFSELKNLDKDFPLNLKLTFGETTIKVSIDDREEIPYCEYVEPDKVLIIKSNHMLETISKDFFNKFFLPIGENGNDRK